MAFRPSILIRLCGGLLLLAAIFPSTAFCQETEAPGEPNSPEQVEFFEAKIRPLLIENCFECHSGGSKRLQAGLRLDSRLGAIQGGDSGPAIIPGKPDDSLLIQAIQWKSLEMPPRGKLHAEQIQLLTDWVAQGASWPAEPTAPAAAPATYDWTSLRASHWAWKAPIQSPLPAVRNESWCKTPIDRFVLAKLEEMSLSPAPAAEPRALVRRVYFDLIGLPPSPDDVDLFVAAFDRDADAALSALIDRLLELPQYGERWGRHWLDVARYSDLTGTFGGPPIPHAWRYRDWVVSALNRDMPYDEFLRWQVAGDLMGPEQAVATGFFALGPTYVSDGGDPDAIAQALSETLDDRVDTLTRGLLGLTVSCARCHDHKFDPIPQLDYYSLAGIFHNTAVADHPLAAAEIVKAFQDHQQLLMECEQQLRALSETANKEQRELTEAEIRERDRLQAELERLKTQAPPAYPVAHSLAETGAADMPLAIRGNLRKPGEIAPRRFLRILSDDPTAHYSRGSGRLDLADSLASSDNPLTARVIVNRVWMQHFGRSLVRTPSNFGVMGEKPTHPELLDWLAVEFASGGQSRSDAVTLAGCPLGKPWSLKRLHKLLLMSATYRMSSLSDEQGLSVDPDNRLLWRANPRRLDVEAWRDALLTVSGELDGAIGGPAVDDLTSSTRRTLYGAVDRNGDQFAHQTFMRLFDFPPARATSEGRSTSTTPQQFLFLMNSPFMAARARTLAARVHAEAADDGLRIEIVYRLLYSRTPTDEEREAARAFLAEPQGAADPNHLTLWEQYAQVLLSSNEFMYLE